MPQNYLKFWKVGKVFAIFGYFRSAFATTATEATTHTKTAKAATRQTKAWQEKALEPFWWIKHHCIDHVITKLIRQIQTKGAIFIINFTLFFIWQYSVSLIDFFELKKEKRKRLFCILNKFATIDQTNHFFSFCIIRIFIWMIFQGQFSVFLFYVL